ncbi:ABC transporter ATP-binding protein [Chitiniphilus purpureus]|uniref:ABC transporter ATP-binding protein n=1 Tax=Chitiniphilus purpureus TaxID=2981137 RepID=A0ABY6DPX5_9NEIS|nr:ABC transporter ATP-binding protein [Chitiniphilus sp. CD1]UXY15536.1 ABC transporter ATP-binding protein [Chitiniphilus sp. CD1]
MYSEDILISVRNVSKCFHIYEKPADRLFEMLLRKSRSEKFWAVKNVSLQVKRGEAVAVIGRNGSGKSTLLQMVCGTLQPTAGEVILNGKVAALLELGAGFNPEYTGRENIYFSGAIYGLSAEQVSDRMHLIEEFAEIGDFIDQPVKTYSSGMFVRLAFALIVHVDADVLVIDEALAVGDVFFTQKCMRFIRDFLKRGALLFVSHDTNSVMSFCRDALWLDKGEVLFAGSAKYVCEKYLEDYYSEINGRKSEEQFKEQENELKENPLEKAGHLLFRDSRQDFVVHTNLRMEYSVELFDCNSASFGEGGGRIINVAMHDKEKNPLSWVIGGEIVTVRISAHFRQQFKKIILGFVVRNKNGQHLFGDNTCVHSLQHGWLGKNEGEVAEALFTFVMPRLPAGDYVISAALADGMQDQHVMHQWVHDALVFRSHSNSISSGLVGLPVQIELR